MRQTTAFAGLEGAAGQRVTRVSTRWAGYIDSGGGGSFTSVQASWVQPRARCGRPNSSAAFWIGLGGATASTSGLEQVGTSADCSGGLMPSYSAWYELIPVPGAPVELPIAIAPGNTLWADVRVRDRRVVLTLRNLTTGRGFSTQTTAPRLDLSSAEWIAEAPSFCLIDCAPLPLPDFGSVTFKGATASEDGRTGTIADAGWAHQSIELFTSPQQPAAVPSALSVDGRSFSVRWRDPSKRGGHR